MKPVIETIEDLILLEDMDGLEDESGEAYGVVYAPNEELCCGEKELRRDRHRWELDPASSEDYRERAHPLSMSWRWRHFNA